jgi:archaellum component FlaC
MSVEPDKKEAVTLENVMEMIKNEFNFASSKFPPFNSPHEGYAILLEEVDEMWDEIKRNRHIQAREECIQVAAMALRYLIDC